MANAGIQTFLEALQQIDVPAELGQAIDGRDSPAMSRLQETINAIIRSLKNFQEIEIEASEEEAEGPPEDIKIPPGPPVLRYDEIPRLLPAKDLGPIGTVKWGPWADADEVHLVFKGYAGRWEIADGTEYDSPGAPAGLFTTQNLIGKSIVGLDPADADYNAIGKTGGAKNHNHPDHTIADHTAADIGDHAVDAHDTHGTHKHTFTGGAFSRTDTRGDELTTDGPNPVYGSPMTTDSESVDDHGDHEVLAHNVLTHAAGLSHADTDHRDPFSVLMPVQRVA